MSKEIERKWLLKGGDFSFPDKANVIREQLWQYYLEIIVDSDNRIISETRIRYKAGSNNGKLTYKVGNGLERNSAHATDIPSIRYQTIDCARIITVKQITFVIVSAHTADSFFTADRACAVTVFYCAVF